MKKILIFGFLAIAIFFAVFYLRGIPEKQKQFQNTEIVAQKESSETKYKDLLIVDSPKPGERILSPLTITGRARGSWYFEAEFVVELIDSNAGTLGSTTAKAQGDWTKDDFVPFEARLIFTKPSTSSGTLVFKKENPSGLPQNQEEFQMPIRFD